MHLKLAALTLLCVPAVAQGAALRVCSDPNNLPFSNRADRGFENRIADLVRARFAHECRLYLGGAARDLRQAHAEQACLRRGDGCAGGL